MARALEAEGIAFTLIGGADVAVELDAKRAIDRNPRRTRALKMGPPDFAKGRRASGRLGRQSRGALEIGYQCCAELRARVGVGTRRIADG